MLSTTTRAIGKVLSALAVVVAVGLAALILVVPRVTGGAALAVLTGSMTPTIPVGSLVLVTPADPETVKPGDVITFQTAPGVAEYITHRVVHVQRDTQPKTFVTKGDANKGQDAEPVPFGAVRGTVQFHIPFAGTAATYIRTPSGAIVVGLIPTTLLLISLVRGLVREVRKSSARSGGVGATAVDGSVEGL